MFCIEDDVAGVRLLLEEEAEYEEESNPDLLWYVEPL
jgi:hypothetical protein